MKKLTLSVLLLAVAAMASAQQPQPLPIDSAVRIGHLENGLTYYIRHNEMPKQRCEFHIAQAVGATLEEDNQNGLAHFLEHMCFNGTEHFEGKGIINYFESIGVNFGGNINAYTSLDQTVYRLSEVPTFREGIIDSALLVMHDWSCAVSLLPEEIDAERGVIREEWRTGNTASRRMYKESNRLMFPGSKYAIRDVIGDTAVINNFSYQALRDYYHQWYGPDLQAIVVVGDIDVDQIETKIKALWKDVPARKNRGERPIAQVPDNVEPIVAIVQDAEAQQTGIRFICKHDPMPKEMKATLMGYMKDLMDNLVYSIMSERLEELRLKPESPILGGIVAYTDLFPAKDALYANVGAKEGKEKEAFIVLLEQVEKLRRYGVTEDELERAKTDMLNGLEKQYNERTSTHNTSFVNEYITNFLDGNAIPGIETEYELANQILPELTPEFVKQIIDTYLTKENIIVNIQAPLKETVKLPTEAEIREAIEHMPDMEIAAPAAAKVSQNLVKKAPKAGKIKKATENKALGTTEWLLKNGTRVIFKPTDFKQDEIIFEAYSFGGLTLVEDADVYEADLATNVVDFAGIGDFSATDLRKALSGKVVSLYPSINANTEGITGESSVKDLETMLQLQYLYFTAPRRDEEGFNTLMGLMENALNNKSSNPKSLFRDSVSAMNNNYSPRTVLWTAEKVKDIRYDKALQIYKERFANPADFTFTFVGNINPNDKETKRMILSYIGGMKTSKARETYKDRGVRSPKGIAKNYFTQDMSTKTASNRIQYTSYDIPYTLANALNMEVIGRVLDMRYMESIREREGGSYGVGVNGYVSLYPISKAVLLMQFDTDPEKQARLMEIIHEEVNTIVENGPLAVDLQKAKESMLKDFSENKEDNNWWLNTITMYEKAHINYMADYENAVNAVTAETVQAMLKKLVAAGNVFEVVMLPK